MNASIPPTEGAAPRPFPETAWTAILAARDRSASDYGRRIDALARLYWRPIYWYIRLGWHRPHEASKDLTQEFFVRLFKDDFFQRADPDRGSFRGFLKTSLRHFLQDDKIAEGRIKRGGDARTLSLTMDDVEEERCLPASRELTPEQVFDREWARSLLAEAFRRLEESTRAGGRIAMFDAFRAYHIEASPDRPPSYGDVARSLGVTEFQVRNFLHQMRGELKKTVRALVSDWVSDPAEVESELRLLLLQDP